MIEEDARRIIRAFPNIARVSMVRGTRSIFWPVIEVKGQKIPYTFYRYNTYEEAEMVMNEVNRQLEQPSHIR